MRYSTLFGQTQKTIPADAQLSSHKLLYQAGFIRRFTTGRWAFLPLGMRVWEKIYQVIDREMKAIGCQKLEVPVLHPLDIWNKTDRVEAFGDEMLLVNDHYGTTFTLGATAEVMMVELVKMFQPSYRDLPIDVYQFSKKFRDDKRPRGGLLRVREFVMKDAYTFAADEEQFQKSYQRFYDAYLRIAEQLDLDVIPVLADSGAIGGAVSHEFMVDNKHGDNTYLVCDKCDYAANQEKAEFTRKEKNPEEEIKEFKIIDQPSWVLTMEDNIKHYGEPEWRYLKNVVYRGSDDELYIASLRGDQDVNETKLARYLGIKSVQPATDEDLEELGTKHGYVHSWGEKGATYIGDLGLTKVKNFIGGQKEKTTDSINVNYGRDFEYEHLADIVEAKDGDICPECKKGHLHENKSYEWGHVFNIGHVYSKPQNCTYTTKNGAEKLLWMGSYGIGIGRTMALIVETHHDANGMIWPEIVAPYKYHLVGLDLHQKKVKQKAEEMYQSLVKAKIEVLYDDREDVSPGEKLADADLIGCPNRLVVSSKAVRKEEIELKKRIEKQPKMVKLEELTSSA
jgi:prolyl-tRNA synthetase